MTTETKTSSLQTSRVVHPMQRSPALDVITELGSRQAHLAGVLCPLHQPEACLPSLHPSAQALPLEAGTAAVLSISLISPFGHPALSPPVISSELHKRQVKYDQKLCPTHHEWMGPQSFPGEPSKCSVLELACAEPASTRPSLCPLPGIS